MNSMTGVRLPKKKSFLFCIASKPDFRSNQPASTRVRGAFSLRVKLSGHEANHPPSSSDEIRNGEAIFLLPHMSSWRSA
jgi:hypothetical protein